ncbi:MAG: phosphatase PAP2 family protein [Deltaproteobacteria bacterium]
MSPWAGMSRGYRFVDFATPAYLLLVGILVLLFHNGRVPLFPLYLLAHGVSILAIHAFVTGNTRRPDNRFFSFFRNFYPLILYAFLYRESELLNLMFVDRYLDPAFIAFEEGLFGFQPAIAFMNALPHRLVSEFFYMSYFSYYVMIPGVGLALFFRRREEFWHYLAVLSFVFYVCFLAFMILPVAGPPAFFMEIPRYPEQYRLPYYPLEFPTSVTSGVFFHVIGFLYKGFESGGGAFPSSHVAAALCVLYFSWRYLPKVRYLILAATVALSFATVYCRYHYAVDVFAGAWTAAILVPIGEWLYRRY